MSRHRKNTRPAAVQSAPAASVQEPRGLIVPGSPGFWTVIVGLVALAMFLPSIGFEFVYDSYAQILIDNFVHVPRHLWDVLTLRVMGMDVLDFNRPVNLFTLMVDSMIWGKDTPGYHLTNILLHAATVALLFRWLQKLVGQTGPALAAALLFAIHPLHCEAVVEVGNREDLLATLFVLAGLLCATAFRPGGADPHLRASARIFPWAAVGTALFLFLAIASKESGIAGPAALAVYWFLFRRKSDPWRPWLILQAVTGAVVIAFLVARFVLEPKNSVIFESAAPRIANSLAGILLVQCRIFAAEFLRVVWPANLCADYGGAMTPPFAPSAVIVAVVVISQACFCFWGRQRRLLILGTACFWFPLLPVSNLIPIYRAMADRFLYMPMTGVALILAVALAAVPRGKRGADSSPGILAGGACCIVAFALALATWRQQYAWRDSLSLWTQTSERNPSSFNAWLGLGYAYLDRTEPAKAVEPFNPANTLARGTDAEPYGALALTAEALGLKSDAEACLSKAASLNSRFSEPNRLLVALMLTAPQVQRLEAIAMRSRKAGERRLPKNP